MLHSTRGVRSFAILLFLLVIIPSRAFVTSQQPRRIRSLFLSALSSNVDPAVDTHSNAIVLDKLQHALRIMDVVMTSDFYQNNPVLKQFYSKLCKNIEIKESAIPNAGQGLFAKKTIKANTIVSFYPSHALGTDSGAFVTTNNDDKEYFTNHAHAKSPYLHCTDQPIFQRPSILQDTDEPQQAVYLDVNPERKVVPGWVSQYINDGATLSENSKAGVLNYYKNTKRHKNCIHIPFGPSPILATVTTKKVKKGDELLTSYGGTYWLGEEEGVPITPNIQHEIQQSANDLFASIQSVKTVYANQLEALQQEYDNVVI